MKVTNIFKILSLVVFLIQNIILSDVGRTGKSLLDQLFWQNVANMTELD